jgi:hypothetical protein
MVEQFDTEELAALMEIGDFPDAVNIDTMDREWQSVFEIARLLVRGLSNLESRSFQLSLLRCEADNHECNVGATLSYAC